MMTPTPGVASCQPRPAQFSNCAAFLGPGGQLECEKTQSDLFQSCSEVRDGVYLPENFQEDTQPCPHRHRCQPRNNVYFSSISLSSNSGSGGVSAQLIIKHLESLICDVQNRQVCLPDNNDGSIMTIENILKTLHRPPTLCIKNPCPSGQWPKIDESGYFRCKSFIDSQSVAVSSSRAKCKRRQVYLYGKCKKNLSGIENR